MKEIINKIRIKKAPTKDLISLGRTLWWDTFSSNIKRGWNYHDKETWKIPKFSSKLQANKHILCCEQSSRNSINGKIQRRKKEHNTAKQFGFKELLREAVSPNGGNFSWRNYNRNKLLTGLLLNIPKRCAGSPKVTSKANEGNEIKNWTR